MEPAADADLPNVAPTTAFQKQARPTLIPAVDIVKSAKSPWALSKFVRPCAMYEVPEILRCLVSGGQEPSLTDMCGAVRALAGMPAAAYGSSAQQTEVLVGDRKTETTLAAHVQKVRHAIGMSKQVLAL